MANIVLATFGSLGDIHPKIALGLELRSRGHKVTIAAMEWYREKIGLTGLSFAPMAPHLDPQDSELGRLLMDTKTGTEMILRNLIMPATRQMYDDIIAAIDGADLLITGEVVFAANSVVETTGIKWISTSLAPISFFSATDPPVPPQMTWLENLRFMGPAFHRALFGIAKLTTISWYAPYREFRRKLGHGENHDPIFDGKFSPHIHLALFSKALAEKQPDWPTQTEQTGFCFYDGAADTGIMPPELSAFLDTGEPPIVFTLGSAAVMDPRDFFTESIKAARSLNRRAVMLYGVFNEAPAGLTDEIVGFDYAPFSQLFPRAACVVHQAGVGTTGQVLRAGVPHLIMPYGHDQQDNAARCRRNGVAEIVTRDRYNAGTAAEMLAKILANERYAEKARTLSETVRSEDGINAACDQIENVLASSEFTLN
ncbi:MAG: glycosyltransferase family 1 protein [Blastocatellia bacterium]|nr:glycosyltransferase family 1 protein [Blastocatellia bacterium]